MNEWILLGHVVTQEGGSGLAILVDENEDAEKVSPDIDREKCLAIFYQLGKAITELKMAPEFVVFAYPIDNETPTMAVELTTCAGLSWGVLYDVTVDADGFVTGSTPRVEVKEVMTEETYLHDFFRGVRDGLAPDNPNRLV